jgi:hypothetical protein
MNCPKCDVILGVSTTLYASVQLVCVKCGWMSESFTALVTASPAYRLAKLKASGAKPGWYGPDGERCEYCRGTPPVSSLEWLRWRGHAITLDEARLCGFVEKEVGDV